MKARVLMKKIGTANGKPCSLVVVEETVAAQQGCQMFECTCGMKFWTQYYAAFHVKKSHAGEKPADRLKICCDLSCNLDVLASIYINVSDNIHTYLQGGEDETLKRKGEACDLDSSPHAKRLSTADIRNRIPVTTPTEVQFPEKSVDTPYPAIPIRRHSSSPILSSPVTRFSISPVNSLANADTFFDYPHVSFDLVNTDLMDPRLCPRLPNSVYHMNHIPASDLPILPDLMNAYQEIIGAKLPVNYSGQTLAIEENQNVKLNNSPHSKDDNNWISCEPPTTPRLMQACNFSFKSTRPPNDTSSVQMKSADIRMKEHVEQDYRALSSSDQPLEDSSNNMFVDEETQRCKDPSCVTEESDQNGQMMNDGKPLDTHGVNGLEVAIVTETIIDRLDLVADNVQNGVENRGNQSSNEKSESSNKSVADTDTLKYVLDMIAEQNGNIPESEKVDDVSCRSGQQNSVLSTLIDDCKNMAPDKIPAGELAVDDSIASSPFRAFQIPAIKSFFQQHTKTWSNMVVAVQKSHNLVGTVNSGQIYDSSQLQTDIADAACFKANTRQKDGKFLAVDINTGPLDNQSNFIEHGGCSDQDAFPLLVNEELRHLNHDHNYVMVDNILPVDETPKGEADKDMRQIVNRHDENI